MALTDNQLIEKLKERFDFPVEENYSVFLEAFTHRSYRNENNLDYDNERLEFLGDAILELLVGEFLFKNFPEAREGRLSKIKSAVVNTASLSNIARRLDFDQYLRLGLGEEKANRGLRRERADVVESFTAALYLTVGLQETRQFIMPYLEDEVERYLSEGSRNFKGRLLEAVQQRWDDPPTYHVKSVKGPEHAPRYNVVVKVNGEVYADGSGANKKEAEQEAARRALKQFEPDES